MRTIELRDLDSEELAVRMSELKEEIFNLRFQKATGQLDDHRRIRRLKRDVARILTVLRERELAVWEEQVLAEEQEGIESPEVTSADETSSEEPIDSEETA